MDLVDAPATPSPPGHPSPGRGPVVLVGLDALAVLVVEHLLAAGVAVTVVDRSPDEHRADQVLTAGATLLRRDGTDLGALRAAGLDDALAVVASGHDDLRTLHTALTVRRARPALPVVVQLRNPAAGRALAELGVQVLDVARLSAPSIVEACLGTGVVPLDLDDEWFVAVDAVAPRAGTLRSLFGDWAPVAVRTPDGDLLVCPGRDVRVPAGSTATLLGLPADLAEAELELSGSAQRLALRRAGLVLARHDVRERRPTGRGYAALSDEHTPGRAITTAFRAVAAALDRRLGTLAGALTVLLTTSTLVLHTFYRLEDGRTLDLLDSLYLTVVTVGTVGYGDYGFRGQGPWLRVFAIGLIVLGAVLLTTTFALITNLLVTRRIAESLGRRRVTDLAGHVVVVGLGSVGLRVVQELCAEGRAAVVVDVDEDNRYLPQVRALRVPVIIGDATLPETLEAAHASAARAVAVTTSRDLTNVETALALRDLVLRPGHPGPAHLGDLPAGAGGAGRDAEGPHVVLRLHDRDLAQTLQGSFGLDHVRSTAALAAPWFVGAVLGLDVLATFYVGSVPLLAARLRVRADDGLSGVAMADLSRRVRVVDIRRADGSRIVSPRRDATFAAGDIAYVVGPYDELLAALSRGSD